MASSATPLHDSLIELAIPDAHAHAIKWYLNTTAIIRSTHSINAVRPAFIARGRITIYIQSFWALLLGSKVGRHCLVGFYVI